MPVTQLLSKISFNTWPYAMLATVILASSPVTSTENNGDKPRSILLDGIFAVSKSRDITTEIDGRIARLHFLEGQLLESSLKYSRAFRFADRGKRFSYPAVFAFIIFSLATE